jgi:hypothetical protein
VRFLGLLMAQQGGARGAICASLPVFGLSRCVSRSLRASGGLPKRHSSTTRAKQISVCRNTCVLLVGGEKLQLAATSCFVSRCWRYAFAGRLALHIGWHCIRPRTADSPPSPAPRGQCRFGFGGCGTRMTSGLGPEGKELYLEFVGALAFALRSRRRGDADGPGAATWGLPTP